MGDHEDMQKAIEMLDEVKESIINAYEIKSGQSRAKISHLMDAETWMNANKAVELGFADGVLEDEKLKDVTVPAYAFSRKNMQAELMNKISAKAKKTTPVVEKTEAPSKPAAVRPAAEKAMPEVKTEPHGRSVDELKKRLETIKDYI